jgi:hypothetical protein
VKLGYLTAGSPQRSLEDIAAWAAKTGVQIADRTQRPLLVG